MDLGGTYELMHYRNSSKIGDYVAYNAVVNQGLDHFLATVFIGDAPEENWYLGLIDNISFSLLAYTDTRAVHPGWVEFLGITAPLPEWAPDEPYENSLTDSELQVFNITADGDVRGLYLCSDSQIGTDGILWSTAEIVGGPVEVVAGDTFKLRYTINLTN